MACLSGRRAAVLSIFAIALASLAGERGADVSRAPGAHHFEFARPTYLDAIAICGNEHGKVLNGSRKSIFKGGGS